jgi:ADA HAT complex component 1
VIADEEDDGVSLGRLNVAAQSAVGDMLRLLSWSSGLGADKIATPEISISAARQQRISGMEAKSAKKLKRKRPIDSDITEETRRSPAKRRIERRTHVLVPKQSPSVGSSGASPPPGEPQKATMPSPKAVARQVTEFHDQLTLTDSLPPDTTMSGQHIPAEPDSLRRTIESQIGLEILLKHKELRLIDQELAKCQVALEQLRRCSEIAYPASRLSEAVSNGVGPALRTPTSEPLPQSPAPWGVTDGPYSRHYAKWLLPDSRFDGGFDAQQVTPSNPAGKNPAKVRTRGTESVGVGSKSRIRGGGQLKALSSGYPQPKDKAGLVIQKRKSDGLVIKLVCLDCRRENFSSAQGFINHCRIAHNRSFASHDAAADACGEPVEVDETGLVVGNDTSSTSSAGMVHPLIRSAHLLKNKPEFPTAAYADRATKNGLASSGAASPDRLRLCGGTGSPPPSYRSSPMTPNLSALVKLKGLGLDLEKLVSDATAPVSVEDSASDDSGDEAVTPEAAPFRGRHPQVAGTKQPVRSTVSPVPMDRSSGMKGAKRDQKLPNLEILATPSSSATLPPRQLASTSYDPQECDSLGPSPTNESNQAPSLVDDDEDYDPHSPSLSSSVSDDGDDAEPEFEIQDDEPSGPSTRTASATDTEYTGTAKEGPFAPQRGRPSAIRRSIGDREEKHVSFVSPSPAREILASPGKGNEKKRKRS